MESKAHSHCLGRDLRPDRQEGVRRQKGEEASPAQLKPAGKAKKGKDFVPDNGFFQKIMMMVHVERSLRDRRFWKPATARARKCGQR